jgi:hypothetical protein
MVSTYNSRHFIPILLHCDIVLKLIIYLHSCPVNDFFIFKPALPISVTVHTNLIQVLPKPPRILSNDGYFSQVPLNKTGIRYCFQFHIKQTPHL